MNDQSRHEPRAIRNFGSDFYRVLARVLVALASLGLAAFLSQLHWTGVPGNRVVVDFLVFPTAGHLANAGHAIVAYDQAAFHHALEEAAGHRFRGSLPFQYPPHFFVLASVLARIPYPVAYYGFSTASWLLLLFTFFRISGNVRVALMAALTPIAIFNFAMGQTAALVTSLLGLALLYLPNRPLLSAALITVLTFKPQFGLAVPPALLFWRRWTAFLGAMVGALSLVALIYAWDHAIIPAFLSEMRTGYAHYVSSYVPRLDTQQSFYAVARHFGLGDVAAFVVQLLCAAVAITIIAWSRVLSTNVGAAIVALLTLAMTPYVLAYDLLLITLALVFLYRDAAFDSAEEVLAGGVILLTWVAGMWPRIPAGPVAVILGGYIIWRRVSRSNPDVLPSLFQSKTAAGSQ
jgi:hypothetical protein